MRATLLFTRSPRSLRSPAMIKSTTPSSPLWRGAAQRRGGQRIQESAASLFPLVILGLDPRIQVMCISSYFKNIVSLRDKLINLDPGVKHRDDNVGWSCPRMTRNKNAGKRPRFSFSIPQYNNNLGLLNPNCGIRCCSCTAHWDLNIPLGHRNFSI